MPAAAAASTMPPLPLSPRHRQPSPASRTTPHAPLSTALRSQAEGQEDRLKNCGRFDSEELFEIFDHIPRRSSACLCPCPSACLLVLVLVLVLSPALSLVLALLLVPVL
jgi:hypothetical protein